MRNKISRKRAEEVLFAERERAQVTLNSIGDAVLCTDTSGHVTYLNAVAASTALHVNPLGIQWTRQLRKTRSWA